MNYVSEYRFHMFSKGLGTTQNPKETKFSDICQRKLSLCCPYDPCQGVGFGPEAKLSGKEN